MHQLCETCQAGVIGGRPAISGACDSHTCHYVGMWLSRMDSAELDMSAVTRLDSIGLRVLIDAKFRDGEFRIVNPSEVVRDVLKNSGTLEYLTTATNRTAFREAARRVERHMPQTGIAPRGSGRDS